MSLDYRELLHDPVRFVLLHLFFVASSYVMWTAFMTLRGIFAAAFAF